MLACVFHTDIETLSEFSVIPSEHVGCFPTKLLKLGVNQYDEGFLGFCLFYPLNLDVTFSSLPIIVHSRSAPGLSSHVCALVCYTMDLHSARLHPKSYSFGYMVGWKNRVQLRATSGNSSVANATALALALSR